MILLADSGSTKTSWALLNKEGNTIAFTTAGINPLLMEATEIKTLLEKEFTLPTEDIHQVFYYGAGALPGKKEVVRHVLQSFFTTDQIEIHSDLVAAARSLCQDKEGIACIIGTGSNSCFYDGKEIVNNVPPLGYILGDEGSGSALGKHLVADVLKKQLPEAVIQLFFDTYRVTTEEIIENVYRKPFPNRYLAHYSFFLSQHIHLPEIEAFVEKHLYRFFTRNLMQYNKVETYPIHFTGSVAFVFKDILQKIMNELQLQTGYITKEPMPGLITYHKNQSIC